MSSSIYYFTHFVWNKNLFWLEFVLIWHFTSISLNWFSSFFLLFLSFSFFFPPFFPLFLLILENLMGKKIWGEATPPPPLLNTPLPFYTHVPVNTKYAYYEGELQVFKDVLEMLNKVEEENKNIKYSIILFESV